MAMNTKFSILRFSPDPEEVEYVNVAIWIEPRHMVYDPEFPKLRCVAPGYDTTILKFYLDDLHESASGSIESLMSKSSQFVVTTPKSLRAEMSEATVKELQRRYLNKHHVTGKTLGIAPSEGGAAPVEDGEAPATNPVGGS
jgi:hypothetical protein